MHINLYICIHTCILIYIYIFEFAIERRMCTMRADERQWASERARETEEVGGRERE